MCAKKWGKLRLIVDLRTLNGYCQALKFKYENIKCVTAQVEQGDYMISVDLKNGYQHILIHPDFRAYLGICWKGQYYTWRVLPFELNFSPFAFCKVVRVLATYLTASDSTFRSCFYIDDFLLMLKPENLVKHRSLLLSTLRRLGWQVNWGKSKLEPAQTSSFIGYTI